MLLFFLASVSTEYDSASTPVSCLLSEMTTMNGISMSRERVSGLVANYKLAVLHYEP